jgi:TrmH family RNA methyltransferase
MKEKRGRVVEHMEIIRSRQNEVIKHFISLASDGKARTAAGEFLCAGEKLLTEALNSGAEVSCLLDTRERTGLPCRVVTEELLQAVSPLQNSPGPVFTVKMRPLPPGESLQRVIVLENVQDPGNVGTVLRTADAFGMDLVVLCGACADPYNPKTVRASMGAIFRQSVVKTDVAGLSRVLGELPLYGAALAEDTVDIRALPKTHVAVAIGNEGKGLTAELLALCTGKTIIPMRPCAESLNAGVAAAVAMWEMTR